MDLIAITVIPGSGVYEKVDSLSITAVNFIPYFKEILPCTKLWGYKTGSNLKRKKYLRNIEANSMVSFSKF